MLLGALKHGLDVRDVAPSVSFFKGVRVGETARLEFTGSAGPGAAVDLLIHLPVVVALVNTAHPLDPEPALTDLDVLAWRADDRTDRARQRRPRVPAGAVQHRKHLGRQP